jgi:hypothetical protein
MTGEAERCNVVKKKRDAEVLGALEAKVEQTPTVLSFSACVARTLPRDLRTADRTLGKAKVAAGVESRPPDHRALNCARLKKIKVVGPTDSRPQHGVQCRPSFPLEG